MTAQQVGIPFAIDSRGQRFGRAAIDREPAPFVPPLFCDGCRAPVSAVHTHPYTSDGKVLVRGSHYRKRQGQEHQPGCRYDFERQAQSLVVECRGRVVKLKQQYRLLLAEDGDPPDGRHLDGGRPRAGTGPRTVVHPSGRVLLGEALASARRIARLLHLFDNDPVAVDRFRAEYRGTVITWPRFFYTPERVEELAGRFVGGDVEHPLAVYGQVHEHGTASSGNSYFVSDRPYQVSVDDRLLRVQLTLRTTDSAVRDDLVRGTTWLGFGRWKLFPTPPRHKAFIQLWLDGPWNYTAGDRIPVIPNPRQPS